MTHDAELAKSYDTDPLHFGHITLGWFAAVTAAQASLFRDAFALSVPIFCIAAGDDRAASVDATRRFFEIVGSRERELDVRPGLFHEVLNEPDWALHAERFAEHMLRFASR